MTFSSQFQQDILRNCRCSEKFYRKKNKQVRVFSQPIIVYKSVVMKTVKYQHRIHKMFNEAE